MIRNSLHLRARLHNLQVATENNLGCRFSWIAAFTVVALLAIGGLALAMKVENDENIDWADQACAEVTNQNRRMWYWDDSSQHHCRNSVQLNGWPCVVDGTEAAVCRHRGGGIEVDTLVFGHHSRNTIRVTFLASDPRVSFIGDPPEEFFR